MKQLNNTKQVAELINSTDAGFTGPLGSNKLEVAMYKLLEGLLK